MPRQVELFPGLASKAASRRAVKKVTARPHSKKLKGKARPVLSVVGKGAGFKVATKIRRGRKAALSIFLQGQWLRELGFVPGTPYWVEYNVEGKTVVINQGRKPSGSCRPSFGFAAGKARHVTPRSGTASPPTIHLEDQLLTRVFEGVSRVMVQLFDGRLVVRPEDVKRLSDQRREARRGDVGSVFTGAGFLDLAAEHAGYEPVFGIEIEEEYAGIYRANWLAKHGGRPDQVPVHMGGVGAVVAENWDNARMGMETLLPWSIELLIGGIPCQPYSKLAKGSVIDYWEEMVRDSPKKAALVGLTPRFVQVVQQTNPYNVVIEQVEHFKKTDAFATLVEFLKSMGYHVNWEVIDPANHGYLAGRKRLVIVATTDKPNGDWRPPKRRPPTLGASGLLDKPSVTAKLGELEGGWIDVGRARVADRGFAAFLKRQWARRKKSGGTSFKKRVVKYSERRVPAIVKGYYNWQQSGPFLPHPTKKDVYRLFSVEEVRRLHGASDYSLGLAVGPRGGVEVVKPADQLAVLGQGVVVGIFCEIIARLPHAPRKGRCNA